MRISDWSSDVCSSDLICRDRLDLRPRFAIRTAIFDRLHPLALLKREERPLHRFPLILQRKIAHQRDKQVELRIRVRTFGHAASILPSCTLGYVQVCTLSRTDKLPVSIVLGDQFTDAFSEQVLMDGSEDGRDGKMVGRR